MTLEATLSGIGFWCDGLPSWADAVAFAREGRLPASAPARPSPQLLAPNERRRAPESVAVALEVALAACTDAGIDPASVPSVFASTHGDLGITDYMSATLASGDPAAISPTKFHNSVHNAAAGYWTIGAHCMHPATALSAYDATFAQGLIESLTQLAAGDAAVLLAAYDTGAPGPLAAISNTSGLLGGALVLVHERLPGKPRLRATLVERHAKPGAGPLALHMARNAMAPMLQLFDALAAGEDVIELHGGPGRTLRLEIAYG